MTNHIVKGILTSKDDDGGWEFSIETASSGRLQKRERVDEAAGWNINVHPNDHPPPHVHCRKDDLHVVVRLDNLEPKTRKGSPKRGDMKRLLNRVKERRERYTMCYYDAIRRHAA